MKKTVIIPLAAGLFLVIVIGTGMALSIKNKEQLAAQNSATTAIDKSGSTTQTSDSIPPPATTPGTSSSATATFKDGTYSANGSYRTPGDNSTVNVAITIKSNVVSSITVTKVSGERDSNEYISMFNSGISGIVVGRQLDSNFNVSEVNGSSLTGSGFTQALQAIRAQAKA